MIPKFFKASFFTGNRQRFLETLPPNAVVVIAAHRPMQRSSDSHFAFSQEPNFYYLTGIREPDWRLVLDAEKRAGWLVAPPGNATLATFDGALGSDEARVISGAERVLSQRQYQQWLKKIATAGRPLYTLLPQTRLGRYFRMALNPAQRLLVRQLQAYGATPRDCRQQLARLRAIKQKPEIEAIQAAINITLASLEALLPELSRLQFEYEVEAFLSHEFRRRGAEGHAYSPIVAAGAHACTLHYGKNSGRLRKNDGLLLDVGASVHGYAADITRTIPLGETTAWQRDVAAAVGQVHNEAAQLLMPGTKPTDYVQAVDGLMLSALKQLGLIKRRSVRDMRRYFPHAIGHGLGIDVHDSLGRFETFQENMVLTVEPGIYVPEKGFGLRLENDFLITKNGAQSLSAALPNQLVPGDQKRATLG